MPADLRRELASAVADDVATPLAAAVRRAGSAAGPYGRLIDVKVRKGTEPTISVGGSRVVGRGGARGKDLFYGVEWGGSRVRHQPAHKPYQRTYKGGQPHTVWRNTTRQFVPAHPFVYPTFRAHYADVLDGFLETLDPFLDAWEAGSYGV